MKHARYYIILGLGAFILSSCSLFKPKYGCGDNGGRNVGAEKLLSAPPSKKTKKFKA
jgi:hypothetical protein